MMTRTEVFKEWIKKAPTSLLMVHLEAIREGWYPNLSRRRLLESVLWSRVPTGCILVWNEKRVRW